MTERSFLSNVMECKKVLEDWGLLLKACVRNINRASPDKYSERFVRLTRGTEYIPLYKCAIENDDYDYLLKDGSFFQFSYELSKEKECEIIRLAFYPSIDDYTYESFLKEELETSFSECGSEYYELFLQYISEQEPSIKTVFRYDYDKSLYVNRVHSAAHVHFGSDENIRIPINTQLKPSAFVKMVLEYYYYNQWKTMIRFENTGLWISSHDTDILDGEYFDEKDQVVPYYYFKDRKK